jgi:hypothetical protein
MKLHPVMICAEDDNGVTVCATHMFPSTRRGAEVCARLPRTIHQEDADLSAVLLSSKTIKEGVETMPQPKLKVQLKKFHPEALVPEYKSEMAAAFDLHACIP